MECQADDRGGATRGIFRQRLVGDHPDRNAVFKIGFVAPAVERAFQEAKGQFAEE
jgi:hypothetical protein